jgi:hypothetical protein
VDFISSTTTKELISDLGVTRAKASLDAAREEIEALHKEAVKAPTAKEKAFWRIPDSAVRGICGGTEGLLA